MNDIQKMIAKGECSKLEFKESFPKDHDKWLKTAVAFANGSGGTILIGVSDNGSVMGIDESELDRYMETISSELNQKIEPHIFHDEIVSTIEDKHLIIVDISPGGSKPYRLKGGNVYIRSGRNTLQACDESIREMALLCSGRSYDMLPFISVRGEEVPPDKESVDMLLNRLERSGSPECTMERLMSDGLIMDSMDGLSITNAFDLLTLNRRNHEVSCAQYDGDEAIDFVDRKVFNGGIVEQIEKAYRFVQDKIKCSGHVEGLIRKDVYDIPLEAVREAITNALVHRSYQLDGTTVYVSVFPDRVEVESAGMMMVPSEMMKAGFSRRRNPLIASFLRSVGVMESCGSGYRRMSKACRESGLPDPIIEEIADRVRVTIFRHIPGESSKIPVMNSREVEMLEIMTECPHIKKKELAERMGTSEPNLSKLIRMAKDRGALYRDESVRYGGWTVNKGLMQRYLR